MSSLSPIHHTFGPHATLRFTARSIWQFLQPWRYRSKKPLIALREELKRSLNGNAFVFANGREALLAYLKAIGLHTGEEVIVQGYTCVVVPNAIHAAGGVPVYADIEKDTLNLDLEDTEKRITPRTRAILCQHTFGIPADVKKLKELCRARNLLLIEDCAHVVPDGETIGGDGDAVLLSFGRDKAVSGITGGAMLVRDEVTARALETMMNAALPLPRRTVGRLLLYPLFYFLLRPLYGIGIGKMLLALLAKIQLFVPILTREEKNGNMPTILHAMPAPCARLAFSEWKRRWEIADHRRVLTSFYLEEVMKRGWGMPSAITKSMALQKFPLFMIKADEVRMWLKKKNIHLDDGWTRCVICPCSVDSTCANYEQGSDPHAEEAAESILSLPTHPLMKIKRAKELVEALEEAMNKVRHGG